MKLKIDDGIVRHIKLWDLPSAFDIVVATLSDPYPSAGRLTLVADSDSWSYYWNGMGEDVDLAKFIQISPMDYLIDKLGNGVQKTIISEDDEIICEFLKGLVLKARRADKCSSGQARAALDELDLKYQNLYNLALNGDLLVVEMMDDNAYFIKWPEQVNIEYWRLEKALTFLKEALSSLEKKNGVENGN